MKQTIGIVGRPNVGKSSLFNAILRKQRSIVFDEPGTTVDEITESFEIDDKQGFLLDSEGVFAEGDFETLQRIFRRADSILFVVDAKSGVTPFDEWIAVELKKTEKDILLVINKCDNESNGMASAEFAVLGFNSVEVSAAHRKNLDVIHRWCAPKLVGKNETEEKPLRLALIGRPNAGKSTLMNRLCKEGVSRVSPIPHTTRDPVTFEIDTRWGKIQLVDTAGMRRPRAKKEAIEKFSVRASEGAIEAADVVCLLIPSHEDVSDQDLRLLSLVEEKGKSVCILLGFWDRLTPDTRDKFFRNTEFYRILKRYPILKISGKTGFSVSKIFPLAAKMFLQSQKRVSTAVLNRMVEGMVRKNPPPTIGKGNFNILYASQVAVGPPTFVFFLNRKEALPSSYRRYVENSLKNMLDLEGQPIRLLFRSRESKSFH